ncbi:MAG: YkgJ family cysteine cluster protein [Deltaproteobacteria bacterium]|nr:MAG: YkgJ family cysteine cluster protein [Deltaproteobacteria bacterium]
MPSDNSSGFQIFKCQKCGDCCKGYGGAFLTRKEIQVIADNIDADPRSFVAKYCQLSGDKPVLAQGPNGYCIFWDKDCKIHAVKPRACKQWPFIKSVLIDVNNWHIMAGVCPGMRTDVRDSAIAACVKKEIEKQ